MTVFRLIHATFIWHTIKIIGFSIVLLMSGMMALQAQTVIDEDSEDFRTTGDKIDGYWGIWWNIRPMVDRPMSPNYGSTDFKYSGPLSFAWPHTLAPMSLYAPEVNKTLFRRACRESHFDRPGSGTWYPALSGKF